MKRGLCGLLAGLILITSTAVPLTGCFGTFAATNAVYGFNKRVPGSGILRTLLMWVFGLLGVYGVATFLDLIIFNVIEFWTGGDLAGDTAYVLEDGTMVAFGPVEGTTDRAVLTVTRADGSTESVVLLRAEDETLRVLDETGGEVGYMTLSCARDAIALHLPGGEKLATRAVPAAP